MVGIRTKTPWSSIPDAAPGPWLEALSRGGAGRGRRGKKRQNPTLSFSLISISDEENGLCCGWAAEQRRGPQQSRRPPFYKAHGSGHFRAHHSAATAALVLTFTEA